MTNISKNSTKNEYYNFHQNKIGATKNISGVKAGA